MGVCNGLCFYSLCRIDYQSKYLGFFFQAEDGIRDTSVTGVQTCALPILATHSPFSKSPQGSANTPSKPKYNMSQGKLEEIVYSPCIVKETRIATPRPNPPTPRSEERRVGKEWR